jgi:hypothetical protein
MANRSTKGSGLSKIQEMISEHIVEYVDPRFTDSRGKWRHTPHPVEFETYHSV